MRIRRFLPFICAMALLVPSLIAGGLDKYKKWPSSPQGYFMTSAERAEWKANVKTDADAEQFINKFLASRGPGFADDVAYRADMADKHLSVGGVAGSQTLRGKISIVLGPPSQFAISRREKKGHGARTAGSYSGSSMSAGGASGSPGGGASVEDMVDASNSANMSAALVHDYTFTYGPDKLPNKPAKDFVVVVEVNPADGSDKINDRRVAAQLDDILEQAAAARLAAASASAPKP